jgi:competence/damage-inducible protein CinA-like protein
MKICVICTGNELLKGAVVNTNLAYIGERLTAIGLPPGQCVVAPDQPELMAAVFCESLEKFDLIITSGGLGPTRDDLTRDVVCEALGLTLQPDPELDAGLRERWRQYRGDAPPPDEIFSQAMKPVDSTVLNNVVGTAPGLWIEHQGKYVAMLPGPPVELEPMVDNELLPILKKLPEAPLHTVGIMLAGIPELTAQQKFESILQDLVDIAYCATPAGVKVYVSSDDAAAVAEAELTIRRACPRQALPEGCFSVSADVFRLLREKNCKFVTAESCTGGMIAVEMTAYPGSSEVFLGSIVAYANEVKRDQLNVLQQTLDEHGAVSAECVEQMVENVAVKFGVEASVAVSGIAGPGGGTPEKPVGLVYIGAKFKNKVKVKECRFRGGRDMIRMRTVAQAYLMLRDLLISSTGCNSAT